MPQALLGAHVQPLWHGRPGEAAFVGRVLGAALLAATTWAYSLKARCAPLGIMLAPGLGIGLGHQGIRAVRRAPVPAALHATSCRGRGPALQCWPIIGSERHKHCLVTAVLATLGEQEGAPHADARSAALPQEAANNRVLHRRPFRLLQGGLAAVAAAHLAALLPALASGHAGAGPAALGGLWGGALFAAVRNILKNMGPPVK